MRMSCRRQRDEILFVFSSPIESPALEPDPSLSDSLEHCPHRVAIDTALTLGFEDGPDADALVRDLLAPPDQ